MEEREVERCVVDGQVAVQGRSYTAPELGSLEGVRVLIELAEPPKISRSGVVLTEVRGTGEIRRATAGRRAVGEG